MSLLNSTIDKLPRRMVRSAIHHLWKYQEPELRHLDDYLVTGQIGVDIGTWWGPWTAALARRCSSVHSFEPQPQLAAQLREWAPSKVTVHETALSDHVGRVTLHRPDARPGTDGLATIRPIDIADSIDVGVTTLDTALADLDPSTVTEQRHLPTPSRIGFIKIDVEGVELAVLNGAAATIAAHRPRLMIEIEQRHLDYPIDDVFAWLRERNYDGHFLRQGRWRTLASFDVDRDQHQTVDHPKRAAYINAFLFTPAEEAWLG